MNFTTFPSDNDEVPYDSLVLVDESILTISNGRVYFHPVSIRCMYNNAVAFPSCGGIPIGKIKADTPLDVLIDLISVKRGGRAYINRDLIRKAFTWWIMNNAEELEYPRNVFINYYGFNGGLSTISFTRLGRMKWEATDSQPSGGSRPGTAPHKDDYDILGKNGQSNSFMMGLLFSDYFDL